MCRQGPVIFWFEGITGPLTSKLPLPATRFLAVVSGPSFRAMPRPRARQRRPDRSEAQNINLSEACSVAAPKRDSGHPPPRIGGFPLTLGRRRRRASRWHRARGPAQGTPLRRVATLRRARPRSCARARPAGAAGLGAGRSRAPCAGWPHLVCKGMPNRSCRACELRLIRLNLVRFSYPQTALWSHHDRFRWKRHRQDPPYP